MSNDHLDESAGDPFGPSNSSLHVNLQPFGSFAEAAEETNRQGARTEVNTTRLSETVTALEHVRILLNEGFGPAFYSSKKPRTEQRTTKTSRDQLQCAPKNSGKYVTKSVGASLRGRP